MGRARERKKGRSRMRELMRDKLRVERKRKGERQD